MNGYCPPNRFLWDTWTVRGPHGWLLYHLDAPESQDPEQRHDQASIRAAVSDDLQSFRDYGTVLGPGPHGAWDDLAIWTGTTVVHEGRILMFYTGRNQRDGQLQRIGLATSIDGLSFDRPAVPLLEPGGVWYETTEKSPIYKAWRDPYPVESDGRHYLFFTARTVGGGDFGGCIAAAVADDIEGPYQLLPPVLAPGRYAQMEVPQITLQHGRYYLLFSTMTKDYCPTWAESIGGAVTGLHGFVSDSLLGPYEAIGTGALTTPAGQYAARVLDDGRLLGWNLETCRLYGPCAWKAPWD